MSTTRRTAGIYLRKRPLGPNGERLCYNCLGPLPKGRNFNCSKECSENWRIRTSPAYVRFKLFQRDKGICAICGSSDFWEADHIVPVIEGGGECDLANYRTLCIPCHRKVTAELRARLAAKAQAQKTAELNALVESLNSTRLEFGNPEHIERVRSVTRR